MRPLEKIPLQYDMPSTRIVELFTDPEFNKLVNRINEEYVYWDKVKHFPMPDSVEPKEAWFVAKYRRLLSPFKIKFGVYQFGWSLPIRIQQQLHFFDMHIGGSLESRSLLPADDKNRYLISSIMEEAIASSQIEGAVTTRKHAKEMLRKKRSPKNRSEQMIVNNYHTIQRILELKEEALSPTKMLEIHKLVTAGTLERAEDEGAFRKSNDVHVEDVMDGEIVHFPPDHGQLEVLMADLCSFFNTDQSEIFIHPIIKACILHFMIGFIHPFVDGNGRTARAIFYWYLLKKGYWLTEYLSISRLILRSKNQYARAFIYTETDDNDLTYFISYQVRTMKLAYDSLKEYLERKINEKKRVSAFLKMDNVNERQALMLKWMYEEPQLLLTVKDIQGRLNVSNQTARNDLQGLVEEGLLEITHINKKTKAFGKSGSFDELIRAQKDA